MHTRNSQIMYINDTKNYCLQQKLRVLALNWVSGYWNGYPGTGIKSGTRVLGYPGPSIKSGTPVPVPNPNGNLEEGLCHLID